MTRLARIQGEMSDKLNETAKAVMLQKQMHELTRNIIQQHYRKAAETEEKLKN